MAEIVKYNSRLCQKVDTKANWDKATNFIPLKGELIIYSDLGMFKIGDGSTGVNALPFTTSISGKVTKEIGGIAKNTTYTNANIIDVLNDLLFPYVAPVFDSFSTTSSGGTYEYGTKVTVSKATPSFTVGSKPITSIKIGTTDGGSDLYSGSNPTSGGTITLTTSKTFNGTTGGTIYCQISDGEQTVKKNTSISYTYYTYATLSTSTTAPTSGTKKNTTDADDTYSYSNGQYLWLYSRNSGKKIQTYVAGSWADVNTTSGGQITLTLNSGTTAAYYAYRTDKFTANGSARYRLA